MEIESEYKDYLERQEKFFEKNESRFWKEQEKRWIAPLKIFGNVYYVGDTWVSVHLIDTGDGLLLIDGGNIGNTALLIHSIWTLGFRPDDVKWIVLSHGHLDHIGACNFFRNMFGTKIYLGEPDAKVFREHPALSIIQDNPDVSEKLPEIDVMIREGDIITFGNTTIEFHITPGHTDGVISLFFDVTEEGRTVRAGYFGGFGLNTLSREFLNRIDDPELKHRELYLDSLKRMRQEKVDLFLGNHTQNNRFLEKAEAYRNGSEVNPFLGSEEWVQYLDFMRDACLALK